MIRNPQQTTLCQELDIGYALLFNKQVVVASTAFDHLLSIYCRPTARMQQIQNGFG
jgi:hypothetical protein